MSYDIRKGIFTALLLSSLTTFNASAEVESKDPIILTLHDWTGQLITTNLMGRMLQDMGYNVKYQQADYLAQFAGLESGDLHVAMEMWQTTGKEALDKSLQPATRSISARLACRRSRSGGTRCI